MEIVRLSDQKEYRPAPPAVLCLGNFDGVHIAHTALIDEAKRIKAESEKKGERILCGVFTFLESPSAALTDNPPPKITSFEEKAELIEKAGADILYAADFCSVKDMPAEDFMRKLLIEKCGCVYAVCGFNFGFGKGKLGTPELLSSQFGDGVSVLPPVTINGQTVSSTAIRSAVMSGDMELAETMLGRSFSLSSLVVHGQAIGGRLGFATANQLFPDGSLVPMRGIYASYCNIDGTKYPAVSYVGSRPTFDFDNTVRCETHVIGYSGDLYGKTIKTDFLKLIGHDKRYDSPQQLADAVGVFIQQALEFIKGYEKKLKV